MSDTTPATCPQGHPTTQDATFCGVCGARVAPVPRVCPAGHPVAEGQAFCETCGASVPLVATTPTSAQGSSKTVWIVIVAIIVVIALAVAAFLLYRTFASAKEVKPETVRSLLTEQGLACDDYSSVAAGQGTTEAELFNATLATCSNNGSDGERDSATSYGLLIADSAEDLVKAIRVTGFCESAENDSNVVAYGDNWLASGESSNPSATLAQEIASALGGEVTTIGQWKTRVCASS